MDSFVAPDRLCFLESKAAEFEGASHDLVDYIRLGVEPPFWQPSEWSLPGPLCCVFISSPRSLLTKLGGPLRWSWGRDEVVFGIPLGSHLTGLAVVCMAR